MVSNLGFDFVIQDQRACIDDTRFTLVMCVWILQDSHFPLKGSSLWSSFVQALFLLKPVFAMNVQA